MNKLELPAVLIAAGELATLIVAFPLFASDDCALINWFVDDCPPSVGQLVVISIAIYVIAIAVLWPFRKLTLISFFGLINRGNKK